MSGTSERFRRRETAEGAEGGKGYEGGGRRRRRGLRRGGEAATFRTK